MFWMKK